MHMHNPSKTSYASFTGLLTGITNKPPSSFVRHLVVVVVFWESECLKIKLHTLILLLLLYVSYFALLCWTVGLQVYKRPFFDYLTLESSLLIHLKPKVVKLANIQSDQANTSPNNSITHHPTQKQHKHITPTHNQQSCHHKKGYSL